MISSAMPSQRYSWSFAGLMSENGSTAIATVVSGFATVVSGFTAPPWGGAGTSSPALRRPSRKCSTSSPGPNHFSNSSRAVAAKSGFIASSCRRAVRAASSSPSCPYAAAITAGDIEVARHVDLEGDLERAAVVPLAVGIVEVRRTSTIRDDWD